MRLEALQTAFGEVSVFDNPVLAAALVGIPVAVGLGASNFPINSKQ
jgi:hypothetical protein